MLTLRDLLTVFARGLLQRDNAAQRHERLMAMLRSLLNLPIALQLPCGELDRYQQLLVLRGGSEPQRNLVAGVVDLAERIQSMYRPCMAPIDLLYHLRLELLADLDEDETWRRLADLYVYLLDLPEVQRLPRAGQFDAFAHWRNLRQCGPETLTNQVLAIAQHAMTARPQPRVA